MIAEETIVAVKERSDIVALISDNVKLQRRGRSFWGLCPFHKEKSPSFSVSPERNWFHCFGCGKHGGALDYIMELEGLPFPEAVRSLAERFGVEVKTTGTPAEEERDRRRRHERDDLYGVSKAVAVYYEQMLERHPLRQIAHDELERRGLVLGKSEQVDAALRSFHIGYAPYGWDGLSRYLHEQGVSVTDAERLGLIAPRKSGDGHYDAFRHRLMFAVIDKSGRVVAFSGRALPEPPDDVLRRLQLPPMSKPRPGEPFRPPPKYINSPESEIYVKGETVFGLYQARHAIREASEAVVVEGNFDVLSLHARGFKRVVAPLGTAFTGGQAKLIKRYAANLVVLFDGDSAGRKAAVGVRGPAREAGLHVRVAQLPDGIDPDDYSRQKGIEAIDKVVSGARGMLEYLIEETLGHDAVRGTWSQEEAAARIKQVADFIASEDDPNLRNMAQTYADNIASKVRFANTSPANLRELGRLVMRAVAGGESARERPVHHSLGENRKLIGHSGEVRHGEMAIEQGLLGALLDFPELFDDPETDAAVAELSGDTALTAAAIRQEWDRKKALFGPELLDLLPRAIHPFAVGRLASPRFSKVEEARTELVENAKKLRWRAFESDKAVKVQELAQAQGLGDTDAEDELLRDLARAALEKRRLT